MTGSCAARRNLFFTSAGRRFADAAGGVAAQGMLSWRLRDQVAGRELVVATFHLKAKSGAVNDAIRRHQASSERDDGSDFDPLKIGVRLVYLESGGAGHNGTRYFWGVFFCP